MRKALIVEQNSEYTKKIRNVLGRLIQPHEVTIALTGRQACDIAIWEQPGFIILDWEFCKDISANEILENLRSNKKTRHIPVLIITRYKHDEKLRQVIQNGATDFLTKPIHAAKLNAKILYLLRKLESRSVFVDRAGTMTSGSGSVTGSNSQEKRVLFIGSEPDDTQPTRSQEEEREMKRCFWEAGDDHQYSLHTITAARIKDLTYAFRRYKPEVVHFSGHGDSNGSLLFEGDDSLSAAAGKEGVGDLFSFASEYVGCVILNACFSCKQGLLINEHIPYVVCISGKIENRAAIYYSTGFYEHLLHGATIPDAHKFAIMFMKMNGFENGERPKLLGGEKRRHNFW